MKAYTLVASNSGEFRYANFFYLKKNSCSSDACNGFDIKTKDIHASNVVFYLKNDQNCISEIGIRSITKLPSISKPIDIHFPIVLYHPHEPIKTFEVCSLDYKPQAKGILVRFYLSLNNYSFDELQKKLDQVIPLFSSFSIYENDITENMICITGISKLRIKKFTKIINSII